VSSVTLAVSMVSPGDSSTSGDFSKSDDSSEFSEFISLVSQVSVVSLVSWVSPEVW